MHNVAVVYGIVALALAFDFVNGVHDSANSIATVVSTRVLRPQLAVIWAAFFNFIAFLFFGLHVARTVGKGLVDPSSVTVPVIAGALVGAIVWNLVTWYWGIPSSSSHALIGGFVGAAVAHAGFQVLIVPTIVKIGIFIVLAPVLGGLVGAVFMISTYWILRRSAPAKVSKLFRRLQLISAAAYSIGHGANDAQKVMGIILVVLIAGGQLPKEADVPMWVVLACQGAMGLGTLLGGWRIVKTMGQKICHLQPVHGFSAETAGAVCLYGAALLGIPVSTTHTITGAIMGVGSTRGLHAVKWGLAGRIIWAWILTIPASAGVAALSWWIFSLLGWK